MHRRTFVNALLGSLVLYGFASQVNTSGGGDEGSGGSGGGGKGLNLKAAVDRFVPYASL